MGKDASRALRLVPPGPAEDQDEVLRRVSEAVLAVTRELSVRDVLEVIVRSVRSLSGAKYAAIGIPGDRGSFAEFVVDGISERQRKAIGPLPRQHGMLAVMLREGQPLRLADIRTDPRFEGWPHAHPDLSDILGVPIKDGDQVLGFVFAANKVSGDGFTDRDEELVSLFAAHAALALTNARLYERARQLSVLEERARLARDLHDAVSQKLFSIRVKARAASVLAGRDPAGGNPERAAAEMESVAALAGAAQAELRAVIDGLAPPEISEDGLAESLRRYALLAGKAHGVRVSFAADDLPPLGVDREAALYRVAQEALHNALRHSGSAEVRMTVCAAPRRVTLEVTDAWSATLVSTRVCEGSPRSRRSASTPSPSRTGSFRSSRITSGTSAAARSTASAPSPTSPTTSMSSSRLSRTRSPCRTTG